MQTKGKFFLQLNDTGVQPAYWNEDKQLFTTIARDASFYDSQERARYERRHAEFQTPSQVVIVQATKDIPE